MINFEKYLVNKNSELMSALNILNNLTHKVLIIVDDNKKLCGTISDGDLRRNIKDILSFSPRDIATLNPTSVKPTDLVSVALEKMEKSKVYAIVVIEDDKPIGLLRMHDVLRSGIK